jgi:hypothetical protein
MSQQIRYTFGQMLLYKYYSAISTTSYKIKRGQDDKKINKALQSNQMNKRYNQYLKCYNLSRITENVLDIAYRKG